MCLFHSVQCLSCVCALQTTRTGGCVCFTVYNTCIVHVLHRVQGLVDMSVSQCTMAVLCMYSTDHKDWWICLFHSVQCLYCVCTVQTTRTGGYVCFTLHNCCIECVLYRPQGLVDISVSYCTMALLCMCSTEYKDWWLPKVEEVTVDKQRAQKQAAPSSTDAGDAKVCCLSRA